MEIFGNHTKILTLVLALGAGVLMWTGMRPHVMGVADAVPQTVGFQPRPSREGEDPIERLRSLAANYMPPVAVPTAALRADDRAREELGRVLFSDVQLSASRTVSCASCHVLYRHGVDQKRLSVGHDGREGVRNAPTVFNTRYSIAQFWDGRAATLAEQVAGPLLNPVEMGMKDAQAVEARLMENEAYPAMFAAAFPGDARPVSFSHAALAIEAFGRTLVTPSRYDRFARGDRSAMSEIELRGMEKFIHYGCIPCHSGPAVGGKFFEPFGIYTDYWKVTGSTRIDEGRSKITGKLADRYYFKVPSLRGVVHTAPYFHDGSVPDLETAVRVMARVQLGLALSDEDVAEIKAFLSVISEPDH